METYVVNIEKSKIMVFRKGGLLPNDLKIYYDGSGLSIVSSFSYLGVLRLEVRLVLLNRHWLGKLKKLYLD